MAKKNSRPFDEQSFLQAMSEGHNFKRTETPEPMPPVVNESIPPSPPTTIPRPRKGKVSDYEREFLQPQPQFTERTFIGIRPERYATLGEIVRRFGRKISIQGYVDAIILHHFDTYRDEINETIRNINRKNVL